MNKKVGRLVAVLGTSPAVVTETLFAIAEAHNFAIRFTQVEIITTLGGKKRAGEVLEQKIAEMCADHCLDPPEIIWHISRDKDGNECDDIQTAEDSVAVARLIHQVVQAACGASGETVFASLAGGRKTMSYYLGHAMSLYARQKDKLYHVLVPPALESPQSGFFYPKPGEPSPILLPELPFPRLRGFLERKFPDLYKESIHFGELVKKAEKALGPSLPEQFTLLVDFKKSEVWIKGEDVEPLKLLESDLKLFRVLVRIKESPKTLKDMLKESPSIETDEGNFSDNLSELNGKLEGCFGPRARIQSDGRSGRGRPAQYKLAQGVLIKEASSD